MSDKIHGRPIVYNIEDIISKLNVYIDQEEQPFIQEFALQYGINRQYLYELASNNKRLSDTLSRAIEKQELYMLKKASTGEMNPQFAMFRLKQPAFGYRDKVEVSADVQQSINESDRELLQRVAERIQIEQAETKALNP